MSIQSDMKRAGIKLTKEQLDQLRSLVAKEKRQREQILKAIRRLIKEKADPKTGRLKYARDLQTYAILLDQYGTNEKNIFRHGGKKKELPYEEFS